LSEALSGNQNLLLVVQSVWSRGHVTEYINQTLCQVVFDSDVFADIVDEVLTEALFIDQSFLGVGHGIRAVG
tara:strand:+ start:323 stop:538 length:216 start_codon:yes stop_codon:yes gene_type:complete